jgi:hypothetical protein
MESLNQAFNNFNISTLDIDHENIVESLNQEFNNFNINTLDKDHEFLLRNDILILTRMMYQYRTYNSHTIKSILIDVSISIDKITPKEFQIIHERLTKNRSYLIKCSQYYKHNLYSVPDSVAYPLVRRYLELLQQKVNCIV